MAKKRIQLDANFEGEVYSVASGIGGRVRRQRSRRTTLQDVADNIIKEAQRIVDEPANRSKPALGGLPGTGPGGRRNLQHPFRRKAGTKTYRSSFKSRVEKIDGKLAVVVENTHEHAADVEYGTRSSGKEIGPKSKIYMGIPISQAFYRKLKKPLSYKERVKRYGKPVKAAKVETAEIPDKKFNALDTMKARPTSTRKKKLRTTASRSFPTMYQGKPLWVRKSVKTYKAYGILRRAMRRVTSRYM